MLYPKKKQMYKDDVKDPHYEYYTKVAIKEFMAYWHFHIVRLTHEIVYSLSKGDPKEIEKLRKILVTDEVDLFFRSGSFIARKFNIEEDSTKYTILNVSNPSSDFPLFGRWISSLEQVFYDIVAPEVRMPEWAGYNQFFNKREETLKEARSKVTDILGGVDADLKFPKGMPK